MARDHRRLAAIVSADVVGYSLLMGRDDSGTLAGLKAHRQELIDPKIVEYGGRIVKTTGDGLLLEFPSVVDAVRCSVDIQRGIAERNANVLPENRIEFRIGINVGDIIIDGDDIFGDGVNVAARLQTLAEPGGICVSRVVRDQVLDKLSFSFEDLGAQEVKNIVRPVEVYRVDLAGRAVQSASHDRWRWQRLTRTAGSRWLAASMVAVGIAGVVAWTVIELRASKASPAPPAMSVGVMPLVATPGEDALAQSAETWTRDLTSMLELASPGIVAVPAPVMPKKMERGGGTRGIAQMLNVWYLMEGEVRRGQDATLISLRLVNGATGEQIGNETVSLKVNGTARDQARALRTGVSHLASSLSAAEIRRVMAQPSGPATAMDYVLRASALSLTQADTVQRAREQVKLYEAALRRDPDLVPALDGLTWALLYQLWDDVHADRQRSIRRLDEVTSRAVNLDIAHALPWALRAMVLLYMGQWDASLEASARSIQFDPDSAEAISLRAWLLNSLGRPGEALALSEQAIAMDPPGDYSALFNVCEAHLLLGQYEMAIAACEKAKGLSAEDIWADMNLVAAYTPLGETAKASTAKAEVLRRQPEFTITTLKNGDSLHPDYVRLADEHYYSGLRQAGFPE